MKGLPILDRVKLAYKAMTSMFDAGAAQEVNRMLAGLYSGSAGPAPKRNTHELLQTVNDSPWIRACAGRMADANAATTWTLSVRKGAKNPKARADVGYIQHAGFDARQLFLKELAHDEELTPIRNHIFLDAMRKGTGMFTGLDLQWLVSIYYDMVGDVFLLKERGLMGKPVKFWPIPPHWIAECPTPARPRYRASWGAWHADIPMSEVMWFKNPDPVDPYDRGSGTARALDDDLATDEYAAKHCHDDQSECLTRNGWINGLDLTMNDEIATWNHESGRIEYHRPIQITKAPYNGLLHHWEGEHVDAMVTPTHRMWVEQKESPGKGRARNSQNRMWGFAESQELLTRPGRIIHLRYTGWYEGREEMISIPAVKRMTKRKPGSRGGGRPPMFGVDQEWTVKAFDFARFLGYYISEGSLQRATSTICQTEGRYVEDMFSSTKVFPSAWVREFSTVFAGKRRYKWHVRHLGLAEWLREHVKCGSYNKRIPREAFEWTRAAQRELFTGLMNGDGHWVSASFATYETRSKGLADDMQRLCVQLGYGSGVKMYLNRGVQSYSVRIHFTKQVRRIGKQSAWARAVPYSGTVWCVTVPNERFISRRHGSVMVGGNTLKFFKNNARPDMLIMPAKDASPFSDTDRDRFDQWWNQKVGGFWKAFKPLFLKTQVDVKLLEQDFHKFQLKELREHERNTIIQVWGIPPEMFGIVSSSNRSTIDMAPYIFAKYGQVPRLERLRSFLQERLIEEYDERLILDYVSPIPQDRKFTLECMKAQPQAFQLNEMRALAEMAPDSELEGEYGQEPKPQVPGAPVEKPEQDPEGKGLASLSDEETAHLFYLQHKLYS